MRYAQDPLPGMGTGRVRLAGIGEILDDLRYALTEEYGDDEPWPQVVEMAMNDAWDALLELEP